MKNDRYYAMAIEEIFHRFQTSQEGLSKREVLKRQEKYGKNELPKKEKPSILKIMYEELLDPIVLLLLVAVVASLFIGEIVDAIVIILIVLIDLIIGTYEENKANSTMEALEKLIAEKTKVNRENEENIIDSREITVGDYIFLESGDKIPADLRIIDSHNFTVDESILTGESLPVEKNKKALPNKECAITSQSNILFAGTTVATGRAEAVVIRIGTETEVGKIATTMHNTKDEKSPLTIRIDRFSKQISLAIIAFGIILAGLLFIKGVEAPEVLVSVIALAVSAMPEGLPLAMTMALTIASNKMAKKKVITKKLNSVESLGSCTIIASDKTGTLTVNEQTAKKIVLPNNSEYMITGTGYSTEGEVIGTNLENVKDIIKLGVINNEAKISKKERIGDSIDIAFLVLGEKLKTKIDDIEIVETIPYESINKYSAAFYKQGDEMYCTMKGSLEVVLKYCKKMNLSKSFDPKRIELQNDELSKDGYRVIAVATGKINKQDNYNEKSIKDLTFMGLVGFIDPIRKEAIASIKKCTAAGIKVIMITGDHPLTAYKISKDLQLANHFTETTTGDEVEEYYKKGEDAFDRFVKTKKVFSRVTPLQKLRIVESLKRQKEFVAVTGDGVNDAPALKTANIGIAMGSGTDIAKEASKMVVLDDNFKSIVSGVQEGRVAYANIRKITYFLLSCGLAEVLFFTLSVLANMPMPLVAIQLLWLNVVTDGLQDIALSFEKAEDDIMKEPPRDPEESLFNRTLIEEILIAGLSIGILVFLLWYFLVNILNMELTLARGYIMALMIIIQNLHAFNCRSEKKSIISTSLKSNYIFLLSIIGSVLLGIAVIEIPNLSSLLKTQHIPLPALLAEIAMGCIIIMIMECYKKIKYRGKD